MRAQCSSTLTNPSTQTDSGAKTPHREHTISKHGREKKSCSCWEKMPVLRSWIPKRGQADEKYISAVSFHVCHNIFLVPYPQQMHVFHDTTHVYYVARPSHNIFTWSWNCLGWVLLTADALCALLPLKKARRTQKGERWSPWKQALFEKLMQWGMSTLVCADPAEPKGMANGEEAWRKNEKVLQWALTHRSTSAITELAPQW